MATILSAEDSPAFQSLLSLVLEADHHEVQMVSDGREALEYMRNRTPDLIILDAQMPVMDGFSVCERIRRITRLKRIPVIILTAMQRPDLEAQARLAGASAVVRKPLSGKDVRHLVSELLRKSDSSVENAAPQAL